MAGKRAGVMLPPRGNQQRGLNEIRTCHIYGEEEAGWVRTVGDGLRKVCGFVFGRGRETYASHSQQRLTGTQPPVPAVRKTTARVDCATQTLDSPWTPKPLRRPRPITDVDGSNSDGSKRPRLSLPSGSTRGDPRLMWTTQKLALPSKIVVGWRGAEKQASRCRTDKDAARRTFEDILREMTNKRSQSGDAQAPAALRSTAKDSQEVKESVDVPVPKTATVETAEVAETQREKETLTAATLLDPPNPFLCPKPTTSGDNSNCGFVFGARTLSTPVSEGCAPTAMELEPSTLLPPAQYQAISPRPFTSDPCSGVFSLGKLPPRPKRAS